MRIAAAAAFAVLVAATSTPVAAQVASWRYHLNRYDSAYTGTRVRADGRCDGISYGTGARRCGTMSGGPSGGPSSEN